MNPRDLVSIGVFRVLAQGVLFWLAASSLPRHVRAQERVPFDLQAGATCLQTEILARSLIEAQRARSATPAPVDVTIEVRGSAHDPRTAVIRARRVDELLAQRSFSPGPPRCQDFHDAVALAIAMMLQTLAAPSASPAPEPPFEHLPDPAMAMPKPAPKAPAMRTVPGPTWQPVAIVRPGQLETGIRRGSPLSLSTRAAGVLSQHVGSGHGAGLRLELAAQRGVFSLQAGLLTLFSSHESLLESPVRFDTRPLAGSLVGCVVPLSAQQIALRACIGLLWGKLRARADDSRDVSPVHDGALPWLAAQAGLELAVRLGQRGTAFAGVTPVYRPRQLGVSAQQADGPELRQKLPRLGVLFALGLSYDLWRQGSARQEHQ